MNSDSIPISPALSYWNAGKKIGKNSFQHKKRLIGISALSVAVAVVISIIARFLVALINLVTNISFYGTFSSIYHSPADNHLGLWVMVVPVIGGIIIGVMALYGSKAIRGHGIPEAMEQILTNQSKIKPAITYLKPLSSAVAIGTGGPFGAEGPIIATGGALGSTVGQLFKISSQERKIILAAGATAGMSAIFGTPIAAIFLAIELLLFEFSPKAIVPVALACITGAAGHHLLFESGPVFPMPDIAVPSNPALGMYSFIGIIMGILSIGATKIIYVIEDLFEKLPIHWMWWPAIGGLAVGVIGYFAPYTLGVGYDNITHLLSGNLPLVLVISLFIFKFLSWGIALGSGTSGGTLAPLLTIGGAGGAICGIIILRIFPDSGVSVPLSALTGMAAMFAGASRAYLTSIAFALEATMQSHALLPLLGACTASYILSFFLMENTIMTEKIARRGVITPHAYEPDVLSKSTVMKAMDTNHNFLNPGDTVAQVIQLINERQLKQGAFVVINPDKSLYGSINTHQILASTRADQKIGELAEKAGRYITPDLSLREAAELMAENDAEISPVVNKATNQVIGILTPALILQSYRHHATENNTFSTTISLRRRRNKLLISRKKSLI